MYVFPHIGVVAGNCSKCEQQFSYIGNPSFFLCIIFLQLKLSLLKKFSMVVFVVFDIRERSTEEICWKQQQEFSISKYEMIHILLPFATFGTFNCYANIERRYY